MNYAAIQPEYLVVLGDDIDLGFKESVDYQLIYDLYESISFPIAVNKTKFTQGTNTCTEFLRTSHVRIGKVTYRIGYACRAINSLCY